MSEDIRASCGLTKILWLYAIVHTSSEVYMERIQMISIEDLKKDEIDG